MSLIFTSFFSNSMSLDYLGTKLKIEGNPIFAAIDPFGGSLYGPNILYHNGNTYFAFKQNQNTSSGKTVVCKYNGSTIETHIITEFSVSGDYHNHPVLYIDDTDTIWVMQEDHASIDINQIVKADSPESISSFTLQSTNLTDNYDYPKVAFVNSEFVMMARTFGPYGLAFSKSSDGLTWDAQTRVTFAAANGDSGFDPRHYPFASTNYISDGFLHINLYKRMTVVADLNYIRGWSLKTPLDSNIGKVWYNKQETFNKDVVATSYLTETELNTNYQFFHEASGDNSGNEISSIIVNGEISINRLDRIDDEYKVHLIESGNWVTKNFGANYYLNSGSKISSLFDQDKDQVMVFREVNSDFTDTGNNGNIFDQDVNGRWIIKYPYNLDDIPIGQKFLVVAGTRKNGDTDIISSTVSNDIICWECVKN